MQSYNANPSNPNNEDLSLKTSQVKDSLTKVGNMLMEARESKGISIRDIKELTHIPIHHIIAIESGDRDRLPEDLFLTGFIRRYAKAVGLNEDLIVKKFLKIENANPNEYTDEFDMLFQGSNVIPLRTGKGTNVEGGSGGGFFQVYHFYLLIGAALFLVACFLMYQTNNNVASLKQIEKASSSYIGDEELEVSEADIESTFDFDDEEILIEADLIENELEEESIADEEIEPLKLAKSEKSNKAEKLNIVEAKNEIKSVKKEIKTALKEIKVVKKNIQSTKPAAPKVVKAKKITADKIVKKKPEPVKVVVKAPKKAVEPKKTVTAPPKKKVVEKPKAPKVIKPVTKTPKKEVSAVKTLKPSETGTLNVKKPTTKKSNDIHDVQLRPRKVIPSTSTTTSKKLSINVKQESWVRVLSASNNQVIFQGLVKPGTAKARQTFTDPKGFYVRLGNRKAVDVDFGKGFQTIGNGSIVANWAYPSTLQSNIPINLLEGKN